MIKNKELEHQKKFNHSFYLFPRIIPAQYTKQQQKQNSQNSVTREKEEREALCVFLATWGAPPLLGLEECRC